ncbi:exotoxin beta-grasp domain-containing protein [Staphylococcus hyicus]|uniref:exotoxin beta-grasp domain-containing protein n=1 Tax=Staphylococcus hyicus TaxID=1284 RepID=UPI00273A5813|nr:superantigen-like protein [Staphylococcus hyicus]MDP4448625.1 superantigen-like protein [Staphylococcus hyicus]
MKLSTIAKASLALSILTTGVVTTNTQAVEAAPYAYGGSSYSNSFYKNISNDAKSLYTYYSKHSFDFRYQTGYSDSQTIEVQDPYSYQFNVISLVGKNRNQFYQTQLNNIDVFVVNEGDGRQATNYSVGGITKSNQYSHYGPVASPQLSVTNGHKRDNIRFNIDKEEISLKQLDFKIRHQLINHYGLYKNGKKSGSITINMNDNSSHHIDLDSKLSAERMGDVVDSRQIKNISIEL